MSVSKMIPLQRQDIILEELKKEPFMSIADLAQKLNVSEMTVRRDIQKLEAKGEVIQAGGGVRVMTRLHEELSHEQKAVLRAGEKNRIGQKACELITPKACIYLDAGTTSLAMCKFLCERNDLTIVTNDLVVAQYMSNNSDNAVIMVGGLVRSQNLSTVGHLATGVLESVSIDIAFLSASSVDIRGITTPDSEKVIVKRSVVRNAAKCVLICDSSKFDQVATFIAVPMDKINMIITDTNLGDEQHSQLIKTGVDIVLV